MYFNKTELSIRHTVIKIFYSHIGSVSLLKNIMTMIESKNCLKMLRNFEKKSLG